MVVLIWPEDLMLKHPGLSLVSFYAAGPFVKTQHCAHLFGLVLGVPSSLRETWAQRGSVFSWQNRFVNII